MKANVYLAYSIVIPVFNGRETLRDLYSALVEHMVPLGKPFEIIFVDDCSLDDSWSIIKELASKDRHVRGLQLMKNSGQGAATMAGLTQSQGALVMTMDDDRQNPPHEVPRLYRYMDEHPEIDVVFGRPREKHYSLWRRVGSVLVNRLSNVIFEQDATFKLTSFRVMRRKVVLPLVRLNVSEPAIGALLSTLTKRLANVDVDHAPQVIGSTRYSVRKLLQLSLSKFLGFSTFPLRFLASMGLIGISVSIFLAVYVLYRYLVGNTSVRGWTTLVLLLIGLSGFMFLAFGIIGEYLQQILKNTRRNPSFVIRATHGSAEPSGGKSADANIAETTPEKF